MDQVGFMMKENFIINSPHRKMGKELYSYYSDFKTI